MNISVIIPVFNAEKYLEKLFDALDKNKFFACDEILLIDNGSTDSSLEMCKRQEKKNPNLYRLLEYRDQAGSYLTRNFGVTNSKGDILVFTDSDTEPVSNWIETIRNNVKKGTVLAGKIVLNKTSNDLWESFDVLAHLNSEKNAKLNCVATANMAVYREDFNNVGFFENRFSGGDYEWSQRAVKYGLQINFCEEAIVHHPTRKTFNQILKKEQRIAYGAGNHAKIVNKSYLLLMFKYFLKIFKIDTNFKYIIQLKKMNVKISDIFLFNFKFLKIRIEQINFVKAGYKFIDPRTLGIK